MGEIDFKRTVGFEKGEDQLVGQNALVEMSVKGRCALGDRNVKVRL